MMVNTEGVLGKLVAIILAMVIPLGLGALVATAFISIALWTLHGVNPIPILRSTDSSAYKYTIMFGFAAGGGGGIMLGFALWRKIVTRIGLVSAQFADTIYSEDPKKWHDAN